MKIITLNIPELDNDYTILIGQNAVENDSLVRTSNACDLWFHLDNISSPHIILKNNNDDKIPKRYLNYIGTLFRNYKSNLHGRYSVIYTEIKYVKTTNVLGTVIPSKTRLIKI